MSTEPQGRIPTVRAISRDRVDALLERAWLHRVTVVVAPPGAGKTTALAAFAARHPDQVAWLGYPSSNRRGAALLTELQRSVRRVIAHAGAPWDSVGTAIGALSTVPAALAIVLDDIHLLADTQAERHLAELIAGVPGQVHFVLGGRRQPDLDLSALEMAGQVLRIDGDQLRFRTWEAERLFREQYETFLAPDDVARVARQVDGWAAGLQLFHLASRGRDPAAQRRLIEQMHGRNKGVRQYLATNVFEPLDVDLRQFLIDTCVLGVVTADLADQLRGAAGSAEMLETLAHSQMFTALIDDDTYRYHDVLRGHLEQLLLERDGAGATAERFRLAGLLQEKAGWPGEALRCYARAGDWAAVRALLDSDHPGPTAARRALFDVLPRAVVVDDPWLLLARARLETANGQFDAAVRSFDDAAGAATGSDLIAACRAERATVTGLIRGESNAGGWIALAHAGMRRNPVQAAEQLATMGPGARLSGALLSLTGGDCALAAALSERAFADPDANDFARSAALGMQALLRLVRRQPGAERNLDEATEYAEQAGVGWVTRVLRAAEAMTDRPSGVDAAVRAADQAEADGDVWGAALAITLAAFGQARRGLPAAALFDRARGRFQRLGAVSAAAVCSLAEAIHSSADRALATMEARQHGLISIEPVLVEVLGELGRRPPQPSTPATQRVVELSVLGTFELTVHGAPVELSGLRPKARTLLKLLAVAGGQAVSRDSVIEALWPDAEPDAALHNLQVAVSAVRRLLAAEVGGSAGILRAGTSYRLDLGDPDALDMARFHGLAAASRAPTRSPAERVAAAQAALALSRGELLADDGAAEWLQRPRATHEAQHEQLAVLVAADHLDGARHAQAIDVCEAALHRHRYCDELWRTLIAANAGRGDPAAAGLAEARYAKVLDELSG